MAHVVLERLDAPPPVSLLASGSPTIGNLRLGQTRQQSWLPQLPPGYATPRRFHLSSPYLAPKKLDSGEPLGGSIEGGSGGKPMKSSLVLHRCCYSYHGASKFLENYWKFREIGGASLFEQGRAGSISELLPIFLVSWKNMDAVNSDFRTAIPSKPM